MKATQILKSLKALGFEIGTVRSGSAYVDASIDLAGAYDGIHLSIGPGYYSVVKARPNGRLLFIDGKGNLSEEINRALIA